jgi:hypothetical protein
MYNKLFKKKLYQKIINGNQKIINGNQKIINGNQKIINGNQKNNKQTLNILLFFWLLFS